MPPLCSDSYQTDTLVPMSCHTLMMDRLEQEEAGLDHFLDNFLNMEHVISESWTQANNPLKHSSCKVR